MKTRVVGVLNSAPGVRSSVQVSRDGGRLRITAPTVKRVLVYLVNLADVLACRGELLPLDAVGLALLSRVPKPPRGENSRDRISLRFPNGLTCAKGKPCRKG